MTEQKKDKDEKVLAIIQQAIDNKSSKSVVIYHANCSDGFGSAWAIWTVLGKRAEYYPASHGSFDPLVLKGDYCFIVDFSFDLNTLLQLEGNFKHVVVLDHHVGVSKTLKEFGSAIFDNNRSGAGIAWDSFHQDEDEWEYSTLDGRPKLISYIEDQDLWKRQLDCTDQIQACVQIMEHDFAKWMHFAECLEETDAFHRIVERGSNMLDYKNFIVSQRSKSPRIVRIGADEIPVVNAIPEVRSELGNVLAKGYPYAVVWNQSNDGRFFYSLRSDENGKDVSLIAQKYGGNGHKHSAGFTHNSLLW